MNIIYKQFENRYAKDVANLQKQWANDAITFGFVADNEDEIMSYDKEYFYVAFDDETVVGYVTGEVKINDKDNYMNVFPLNAEFLQVYDLYIDPAYRNKNIGAELLVIVERKAKTNNVEHIFLSSATKDAESVRQFYEKNGFKIWTTAFFK
ncbi:MAG: GNAT family N-acetyltransferase [Clostridia bacterium]|nr:GNAT family N-acetyltransferase [Clostridia bacterium]